MRTWKFSANAGFFGAVRDRFVSYQPDRSVAEKIDLVAQVEGISGIELRYPGDFTDLALVKAKLAETGLVVSAVNVDSKDNTHFRYGAFSARRKAVREEVVGRLRAAMDLAVELGTDLVTTCPLADSHQYPFQVDHAKSWSNFIETVRAAASYRADVRLCLEYQPHELQAKTMLENVGKMLYVCAQVGASNLGANLDIGHAFAAGENPAESAVLLDSVDKLFYIHTNDNTGDSGDWDMLSGAVHFWHWLELIYTLDRLGYNGWLGADLLPKQSSPVALFQTNVRLVQRMAALVDRIGPAEIAALVASEGAVPETFDFLSAKLLSE